MFLVFFNRFFNWIRNIRGIANILLINFTSDIWKNVNKEIIKNIHYFVLISNQLIISS